MPFAVAFDQIAPSLDTLCGEAGHLLVQQSGQQLGDKRFILSRNIDREFLAPARILGVEKRRVADAGGTFGFRPVPQFEEAGGQLRA